MKPASTDNEAFRNQATKIIKQQGEMLVLLRYPYQAGNRDFVLVQSEAAFAAMLEACASTDSVTLFKSFETVAQGKIDEQFSTNTLQELTKPKGTDWLVLLSDGTDTASSWYYAENKTQLEETLRLNLGMTVRIIEDPGWLNEDLIHHAYVPDEDGSVRPRAY